MGQRDGRHKKGDQGRGERTARTSRLHRSEFGSLFVPHSRLFSLHPSLVSDNSCRAHGVGDMNSCGVVHGCSVHDACNNSGGCDNSDACVPQSNNSCWLEHGHPGCGGTKTLSMRTGSRVRRSPAGNDCAPVLSHSPRGTSEDLHDRAGVRVVTLPGDPFPWLRLGSTWLSEGDKRGVNVSRMLDSVVPGPGCRRRTQIGWEVLLRERLPGGGGSGFWFWGQALGRFDLFSELKDAVTWVKKKGHSTAWVTDPARCTCTYSYGGRAHSPDKCDAAWPLLAFIWRGIAPLMRPWCWAEEEVPGGVNLNLYSGGKACIPRHSDNKPLFGGGGESKLIVSVSFGDTATFRWARNSDRDGSSGWSQRLSHGDVLVMDGKAQDQFEHWAGVQGERINLTYRWIKRHDPGCVSATAGVLCCLPSCAEGLSVHRTPEVLGEGFFPWIGLVLVLFVVVVGCWRLVGHPPCPSSLSARGGCCRKARLVGVSLWHNCLRVPKGGLRIEPKEKYRRVDRSFTLWWDLCWKWYSRVSYGKPLPSGNDVGFIFWVNGVFQGDHRRKQYKTFFPLPLVSLVGTNTLLRFWGLVVWMLHIGTASNPGPGLVIELIKVGGWLANCDEALETKADFIMVTEHRLVPARTRSESKRLRSAGIYSLWTPACQDTSHVGHAGVGLVSLKGAPFSCYPIHA